MKKLLCALLAASMLICAAGCANETGNNSAASSKADSAAEPESSSEESSSTDDFTFTVTNTPATGVRHELEDLKLADCKPGDRISGTLDWGVLGPIASYGSGVNSRSVIYFYTLLIEDKYVVFAAEHVDRYTLDKLIEEENNYLENYSEGMTEEEIAAILPTTSLGLEARVETMPRELKGFFAEWYTEDGSTDFSTACETSIYLIDKDITE